MVDQWIMVLAIGSWISILTSPLMMVFAIVMTTKADRKYKGIRFIGGVLIGILLTIAVMSLAIQLVSQNTWGGPAGERAMGEGLTMILIFMGSLPITTVLGILLTLKFKWR